MAKAFDICLATPLNMHVGTILVHKNKEFCYRTEGNFGGGKIW